jgi:putative hydrolase of the HAD superfamily
MPDRRQTICFDLDDTLVHCNKYFADILQRFVKQMKRWFPDLTDREIRDKQTECDLAGIAVHGLVKERFPLSLVEAYEYFSARVGRRPKEEERERLVRLGSEVYDRPVEPYPHMRETLDRLARDGHRLCLFTGGDPEIQLRKVEQLDLKPFFGERIFVARHKNTAAFRTVLDSLAADPRETWMIGNSARTDIIPALACGAHAIHIPAETKWEWAYNHADIDIEPSGAFLRLATLKEVPEAIYAYIRDASPAT